MLLVVLCIAFLPSIFDEMHQVAGMVRTYADQNSDIDFLPPALHDFLVEHLDFKHISDVMTRQDIESVLDLLGTICVWRRECDAGAFRLVSGAFVYYFHND